MIEANQASKIQMVSKGQAHHNSKSSKPRSVRPNFLMAKEKAIMDAAKILEMDYNSSFGLGANRGEGLMQTAFRMPTPTNKDKSKIMAGADLIKAAASKRPPGNKQQSHSQVGPKQSMQMPKSIQSAQPMSQKKHSLAAAAADNWHL